MLRAYNGYLRGIIIIINYFSNKKNVTTSLSKNLFVAKIFNKGNFLNNYMLFKYLKFYNITYNFIFI